MGDESWLDYNNIIRGFKRNEAEIQSWLIPWKQEAKKVK